MHAITLRCDGRVSGTACGWQIGDGEEEGGGAGAEEEGEGEAGAEVEVEDMAVATFTGHSDAVYCVAVHPKNPSQVPIVDGSTQRAMQRVAAGSALGMHTPGVCYIQSSGGNANCSTWTGCTQLHCGVKLVLWSEGNVTYLGRHVLRPDCLESFPALFFLCAVTVCTAAPQVPCVENSRQYCLSMCSASL